LTERDSQTLQLECRGGVDGHAAEGDKFEGGGGQKIGGDLCAVVWLPGFNDSEVTGASVEILQRVCVCVCVSVNEGGRESARVRDLYAIQVRKREGGAEREGEKERESESVRKSEKARETNKGGGEGREQARQRV
jgi:hypothetical protein